MAEFYKILKATPFGEPWTPKAPDAKPIQNWWCQAEGLDKDLSIGKQVGNVINAGEHVYGDLLYAKSQKGIEYWKFKSHKVPDDVQRPASSSAQATAQQATTHQPANMSATMPDWFIPINNMILFMYKELRKMSDEPEAGGSIEGANYSGANKPQPKTPEVIAGAPLEPGVQANLDSIFSEDPVPEDV